MYFTVNVCLELFVDQLKWVLFCAGQWEGGQMELHKDEFDILAVIKFLSWGLKDLLEQKEIAFNMNIDEFANKLLTDHRVIGDKQRVVQTLGELQDASVCHL